jgi:putative membrane protein
VPPQIAAIERPAEKLMTYYTIKAVSATVGFPVLLLILYFRYHTMRYKFDAEGIRMSWGILFRREIMVNYSRIQDIHLRSSFIERFLGLARIEIQTAAGSSNGAMTLEGLSDHETMRDFLYSRMRGTGDYPRPGEHEPLVVEDELIGTLHEIAGELRAIRMLIEERQPHV